MRHQRPRPRALRLTGEAAEGTVLDASFPADGVRRARVWVGEGRGGGPDRAAPGHRLPARGDRPRRGDAAARREGRDGHTAERLGVTSDPRAVADAVVEPAEAGATAVILRPTSDEPDPEGFVRLAAEQVRPLVP